MLYRIFEIWAALLLLMVLLPFFLIAVVLVQLDSPGKVIFRQRRIGKKGREFVLYKLRTMKKNANGAYPPHTQVNDPRFSPICRLVRATCIDEIPQLWNIIKGDMGFIGPRPELPQIVEQYDDEQRGVLEFKPGLLGISQLVLREGVNYRIKLKIENAYYCHRTRLKDCTVAALTPFVIMSHTLGRMLPWKQNRTEYIDARWFRFLMRNGKSPAEMSEFEREILGISSSAETTERT